MPKIPNLTFFCEVPSSKLESLFSDSSVIQNLLTLNANISLGLLDFSKERANCVQKFTKSGIPVTAWLLLPKERGYWTSLDTVSETALVYGEFKKWTEQNNLHWAAVGLDLEPKLDRIGIFSSNFVKEIPDLLKRLFQKSKYAKLDQDLRALVNQIRIDGYAVETYNFPFIEEERQARSSIIQRTLGLPVLDVDREVLMLYSSFFPKNGDSILWSYAHQAQAIGLGSSGGGVELENGVPLRSLSWADLQRDLLLAGNFSKNLYIFSLEGCIEKGYLDRLLSMDWTAEISFPITTGRRISILRHLFVALLWIFSNLGKLIILAVLLLILTNKRISKR